MNEENNIELRSEEFQEVLGATPSWILRWGIIILAIILFILLIGSTIFKYPDTISAEMTLTGTAPAVAVVAKTTGKVQELNVNDNDEVHVGDYLAVIENAAQTDDILQLKSYLKICMDSGAVFLPAKELKLGNLQSLYSSFYLVLTEYNEWIRLQYYPQKKEALKNKMNQYQSYCTRLTNQRNLVAEQLQISRRQYERDSVLYLKNVIAKEELESAENQYLQARLSLENMRVTLENTQIELLQMREGLLDLDNQYSEKKHTLESQIQTQINQLLSGIQDWELTYALVAPVDGRVTFTNVWSPNQNVNAGQTIFTVVPESPDQIIGKAFLPVQRSGKVKTGQQVNIRFNNFPDNEFGIVRGTVGNISLVPAFNNNEIAYVVDINLPSGLATTYHKELPYLPEMKAQADIITEDISLMQRLIQPLRKIWTENV
ncbi:MAG: HlyD family efflux transporter periplasmic adaptor subunit [Dysgonamonadaceae bacterium]|jgi:HlyD family secretion protein|nr:HlyD family efflux transporter periplasmic adaptor subunit [Dysgonamonadaceae bacterium]